MELIRQIDRWGRLYPDRAAHISGAQVLTYGELLLQSNRLAQHLSSNLMDSRAPIAILGHKQNEMLVAFLGCVKSGHPYIPLDASLPGQRIQTIVDAAKASLMTHDQVRKILETTDAPTPLAARLPALDDVWYIIFTSGSTGDPKGVMVTRGCLEDFVAWILAEHGFKEGSEIFLNQAPFSFDLSVMDLYLSLATAGTLFSLTQSDIAEPRRLFKLLPKSHVSVWVSTPSFARMCLLEPGFASSMLPGLRKFWFCGETLAPEVAADLLRRFPEAEVWNTYGPTEATVATTSVRITDTVLSTYNPLPVGRPKPGTQVLVHDEAGLPVSRGARGEIMIAGPNVSLGYIHRPDLTSRAFFDFEGLRAYRTGDWGHYEDDLLFFEGRMDFQIKLHGYRIEIGDIESNLHRLASIRDAVVVPIMKNGRTDYLVAFIILKLGLAISEFDMTQDLKRQLAARLPDYMVPRKFVFLSEFPTTTNGKIDRKKLAGTVQ